jgi:hypothetical protein
LEHEGNGAIFGAAGGPGRGAIMTFRKRAWIAAVIGLSLSTTVFILSCATRKPFMASPQFVGFYVCWRIFGFESASVTDYAFIALPVNAASYS